MMTATQDQLAALAALGEAIEAIEDWGCYVPDHFKDKHDIQGDIDRLTAIKEGTTDAD